jgi:ABC-type branched-subunit amino acid transport system ATPase component/sugar phosphate permease
MSVASDLAEAGDDPAVLAGRLLEGERRRQLDTAPPEPPEPAVAELPGVGDAEVPLRDVVRAGGAATLVVLVLLNVIDEFDKYLFQVLGPDIQTTFHLSDTGLTMLGGAGAVALFLAAVPLGALADRGRRTFLIGVTSLVWAGMSALGGLTRSAWQLGATRFVTGLGKGNTPVGQSLLADRYPIAGRGRIYAIYNMANPVGAAIGPVLVAGVATVAGGVEGWRWALVILGLPAVGLALLAFGLPEPERGGNEREALHLDAVEGGAAAAAEAAAPAAAAEKLSLTTAFERLRMIKTFSAQMSAIAALGFGLSGTSTIFGLVMERDFGLGSFGRATIISVGSIGGFVGIALGGRFADRSFREDPARVARLVGVSMVGFGVLFTLGINMPTAWLLGVCFVAAQVTVQAPLAMNSALLASVVPPRLRGSAFAVLGVYFVLVGGLVGGVITAVISDAMGARTALTVVVPIAFAGAGYYMYSASRHVARDLSRLVEELREEDDEAARVRAGQSSDELLQVRNIDFSYGPVQVLFDVDVTVHKGETLALLGTNGAGKSTLLRVISGLALPERGVVRLEGRTITYLPATERVRHGIVQVPGGKAVFRSLTVEENLLAGAHTYAWDAERLAARGDAVLEMFPALRPLLGQPAGTLSGGEQQMLAIAKALLLEPRLLLIDELSLGLAPVMVQEMLAAIDRLKAAGITIVIVEQSINVALAVADRAVFMEKGRIRYDGPAADLLERHDLVRAVFLGEEGG